MFKRKVSFIRKARQSFIRMLVTSYQFVFAPDKRIKNKSCYKCGDTLENHELIFSRRHKKYYCLACAERQGFL